MVQCVHHCRGKAGTLIREHRKNTKLSSGGIVRLTEERGPPKQNVVSRGSLRTFQKSSKLFGKFQKAALFGANPTTNIAVRRMRPLSPSHAAGSGVVALENIEQRGHLERQVILIFSGLNRSNSSKSLFFECFESRPSKSKGS